MINYRAFCDTIDVLFDPSDMVRLTISKKSIYFIILIQAANPGKQLHHEHEYLGTSRTLKVSF